MPSQPTLLVSLQALADEWSTYWDVVTPQSLPVQAAGGGAQETEPKVGGDKGGLPRRSHSPPQSSEAALLDAVAEAPREPEPERHHLLWPEDLGDRPDRPSVAGLRKVISSFKPQSGSNFDSTLP
eukprot:615504-Pyramimonas_sp.AAC.1